jgi:type II secretory pathway pseudopilin PulG
MVQRMITTKLYKKMKGLTLLETMFAISIGALVLVSAIVFYGSTKQSANINKAVRDLNTIVAQTQTYMVAGGVSDLSATNANTVDVLQKNGYLPNPISDPWGQQYTGTFTLGSNTTPTLTTITIVSLGSPTGTSPDKNCVAIGQALSGVATAGATGCSFVFTF